MKEQTLIDLEFEKQTETAESSGYATDWYYYTLDIGGICFITNSSDESSGDNWTVHIFEVGDDVNIKNKYDLVTLINIFKRNTV